jgi:hypothetical protein
MRGAFWADRFDSELVLWKSVGKEMENVMKIHLLSFLIIYSMKLHKILRKLRDNFILTAALHAP